MYVPSPASTAELLEMTLFPFSAPEFLKASADADELGAGIPQAFTATDRSVKIQHKECGLEKKEFTDGVGTIAPKFCGRDQNTAKRVRIEPRVKPRQSIGIPISFPRTQGRCGQQAQSHHDVLAAIAAQVLCA
jgi:hypothetical protein